MSKKGKFDSNRKPNVTQIILLGILASSLLLAVWYSVDLFENTIYLKFFAMFLTLTTFFLLYMVVVTSISNGEAQRSNEGRAKKAYFRQLYGSFRSQVVKVMKDFRERNRTYPNQIKILVDEVNNILASAIAADMDPGEVNKDVLSILKDEEERIFGTLPPNPHVAIVVSADGYADVCINGERV